MKHHQQLVPHVPHQQQIQRPDERPPDETPPEDWTLVREWLRSKRSVHTRKAYKRNLTQFYLFVAWKPLAQVTLSDLQDYAATLEYEQKEPATVAQMLATIKSILTFGMKTGRIPFNPGAAVQLPQGKDKLAERILTPLEISAMLQEAQKHRSTRDYALLLLLYGSGIRCSELCGLQWRDVQENGSSGQITVVGKRQKTRSILLHPAVWEVLQAYKPEQVSADDYVFPSRQQSIRQGVPSRRLTPSRVWQIVADIAQQAGVRHASPHFLRHTHATIALRGKASLKLVQETLGHSSLAVTGRYLHVRPEESSSNYLQL